MQALTFFFYCFVVGILIVFIVVSLLRRKSTTKSEPTFDNQLNEPPVELVEAVPTAATFRETLFDRYTQAHTLSIEQTLLGRILNLFTEMYAPCNQQQYNTYLSVCSQSLVDFTRIAPQICLEPLKSHSVFKQQCNLRELSLEPYDRGVRIKSSYHQAYKALAGPFLNFRTQLSFLDWRITGPDPHYRECREGETREENDRYMRDYWKRYEESLAEIKRIRPYAIPLMATPLFIHAEELVPTDLPTIPFEIPEEARFRGQWIVGAPGAGKTTFISAMIAEDLKKVARNEASVFVMDSQNELIPDIANLELFAPGRPLHGKLIYLEPDPDFPLALNIFDTNKALLSTLTSKDRAMLESGAIWMVEFFLSSLVKSEASPHQDTFLNYVIPALLAIPNATIFTFKELLEPAPKNAPPPGYERYKQHFGSLRPDTQDWLRDRMHSTELAATRSAIRARLDGFTARGFFHDMFMHPRNKLDLFEELQNGKVILVNTMKGLLKNGTEPFGRYFIARLLQAAEERMFLKRGNRLPVYAYIDEASDYISEEANIEELINKARKQRVALIIASQMESQITFPTVRDALSRMGIQCRGQAGDDMPRWQIAFGNKAPVEIIVPNVDFTAMPKMSERDFTAMQNDMRRRFSGNVPSQSNNESASSQSTNNEANYDLEWTAEISPKLAESGGTKKVHGFVIRIMPATRNGHRVRLRSKGAIKPDGTFGDAFITFTVRRQSSQAALGSPSEYYEDETDAKPW